MNSVVRVVAGVVTLCLMLLGMPAAAAGSQLDRVGGFDAEKMLVRIDKAGGTDRWVKVNARTRVVLVDKAGQRVRGDADDLVRGARVLGSKIVGGKARAVSLKELGFTGGTHCSFDSSHDDGDEVGEGNSFDCSHDYDDSEVETDSDCTYDSSLDGPANDWSMDTSWDCGYSESADDDRDDLEWGCGYEASAVHFALPARRQLILLNQSAPAGDRRARDGYPASTKQTSFRPGRPSPDCVAASPRDDSWLVRQGGSCGCARG
jgi:hypothetical protein